MAPAVRREQAELTDTIFAVSSGRPPAAIAIIRVSGPGAFMATEALAGTLPPARQARARTLRKGEAILDSALVLVFPAPKTATGEDLVELHCHGGRAVVSAVEAALAAQPGLRQAEPGEFTRRALLNGRIDLLQAEGLADLLEAETEAQRVAATAAAEGQLSARTRAWLDRVLQASAQVEAILDYAEEDDIVDDAAALESLNVEIAALREEMERALAAPSVERLKAGVSVVIAGPPNAGKSTLLNVLAQREAAIVSPIPGTTRDRVEASIIRAGLPLLLIDTAGLTETVDLVEAIGVRRAGQAIDEADVLLWLGDDPPPRADAIWVFARSDGAGRGAVPSGCKVAISALYGHGIDHLWMLVQQRAQQLLSSIEDAPAMRERQRLLVSEAACALIRSPDLLVVAEGLAAARRTLARLLGLDATEAMLDVLFGRFCLGK